MPCNRRAIPICPGVLELNTNRTSIPDFQLASGTEDSRSSDPCEMSVTYTVGDIPGMDHVEKGIQLKNGDVFYKKSIGAFGDLRCKIDIGDESSALTVNETYHRFGRASIDSVPSVGKLLEDVISLQLLTNGYMLLYCSAFNYGGETTVLIGLSNTGKTTVTFDIIKNNGAKYLSDDIAITDGENLYCCPYALSSIDSEVSNADGSRFYEWAAESIPMFDRLYSQPVESIYDILSEDRVCESDDVSRLFILSRWGGSIENLDASRQIRLANKSEFRYSTNQILLSAQYLGHGIDIDRAVETERDIINNLISDVETHRFGGEIGKISEYIKRNT